MVSIFYIMKNHLYGELCPVAGLPCCRAPYICFNCMRQGVHSGGCRKIRRQCVCYSRIKDCGLRNKRKVVYCIFVVCFAVCYNGCKRYFASGTCSCRNGRQKRELLPYFKDSLQLGECFVWPCNSDSDSFCAVHG